MTLQQEAYRRIDQMTDDGIRILIDMIDKMKVVSVTGFKDAAENKTEATTASMSKEEKKKCFIQSAGKIKVDSHAVNELRERSMI